MRRNLLNLVAALAIFVLITGCFCRSERYGGQDPNEDLGGQPTPQQQQQQQQQTANQNTRVDVNAPTIAGQNPDKSIDSKIKKPDNGDFTVEHVPVQNQRYAEIDRQVKEEKLLERASDKLNRNLLLPYNIPLRTADCGEPNAFYNPRDRSITVCYELMEHFYKMFKSTGKTDQEAYDKMFDAIRFAFLHELGHALIDAYQLPVIGNEEDAADRCSSYICLTELGDEGVRAVLAAADAFAIESKGKAPNSRSMADEHLLQEQRFYNTLCMIYGSDTGKYDFIAAEGYLPRERAVRCPSEFQRTVQSWSSLFEPWRKE